jgi:hypothetical protein
LTVTDAPDPPIETTFATNRVAVSAPPPVALFEMAIQSDVVTEANGVPDAAVKVVEVPLVDVVPPVEVTLAAFAVVVPEFRFEPEPVI